MVFCLFVISNLFNSLYANNTNKGKFANIVVFVRFSGDDEYVNEYEHYDNIFNSTSSVSLYDYFKEVSYNQLEVTSHFLNKDTIISYKDKYSYNYYTKKSNNNSIGYSTDGEAYDREKELLQGVFEFVRTNINKSLNVDLNSDDNVDNITIILKSNTNPNSTIIFPHQSKSAVNTKINGKSASNYTIIPSNNAYLGMICHEFFHSLGATDLYRTSNNTYSPMYYWDLMDSQCNIPQHPSVYTKFRYGKWIDSIPSIKASGEYYLNPLSYKDTNCYKIITSVSNEYVVLEYRKPTGKYESSLRTIRNRDIDKYEENNGGMLIYRVDETRDGQGNYSSSSNGPDEIYCYRPDGTNTLSGKPWNALFHNRYGRSKFNINTNPAPKKHDGTFMNFSISDIYETDGKLYFSVNYQNTTFIKYPMNGEHNVSLKPVIRWAKLENNKMCSIQIAENANFNYSVFEAISTDSIHYVQQPLKPNTYYGIRIGVMDNTTIYHTPITIFHTTKNLAILSNITEYCAGDSVEIYYEYIGSFNNTSVNVYLTALDETIKEPILLKNKLQLQNTGVTYITLPKNIPTGYKYKLLFQDAADSNNKSYTLFFRIKGLPEAKFNTFDSIECKNSTTTISFTPVDNNVKYIDHKYSWKVTGGTIIKDTNNSITILWNTIGNAEVKIIAQNDRGCEIEYVKNINVIELPQVKFSAKNIVCSEVPISYYLPDNNSISINITNGSYIRKNKDTIAITWENVDTGYVRIINKIHNCSETLSVAQKIKKMPTISIVGINDFCKNDTSEYLINIANSDEYLFKWDCPNGTIISSKEEKICKVTGIVDTLKLTFSLTDKNTNCTQSTTKHIILHNLPDTPVVNLVEGKLVSSVEEKKYQWFLENKPIENSNSKSITPTDSGDYYVIVENKFGCKNQSLPYNMPVGILENNIDYKFVQVGNIISIYFPAEENVIMELYDLLGNKLLSKQQLQTIEINYNMSQYTDGVYILRLYIGKDVINKIIMKL